MGNIVVGLLIELGFLIPIFAGIQRQVRLGTGGNSEADPVAIDLTAVTVESIIQVAGQEFTYQIPVTECRERRTASCRRDRFSWMAGFRRKGNVERCEWGVSSTGRPSG